jgi:hypothetical protein
MALFAIELLPEELRERCTSDAVGREIVHLVQALAGPPGAISPAHADRLTAAIDDLIKARLDERQEAIATAILEAAP